MKKISGNKQIIDVGSPGSSDQTLHSDLLRPAFRMSFSIFLTKITNCLGDFFTTIVYFGCEGQEFRSCTVKFEQKKVDLRPGEYVEFPCETVLLK